MKSTLPLQKSVHHPSGNLRSFAKDVMILYGSIRMAIKVLIITLLSMKITMESRETSSLIM